MTSFCRRVIAMRMIVANKKRIASFFVQAARSLMTYLIHQWRVHRLCTRSSTLDMWIADRCVDNRLRQTFAWAIPILKSTSQNFATSSCLGAADEPR